MPEANDPWASLADNLGAVPAPESAQPKPAPPRPPRAAETRRPETKKPVAPAAGSDWTDIVSGLGIQPDPVAPRPAPPVTPPPAARDRAPLPPAESFDRRPEGEPRRTDRQTDGGRPPRDVPPRAPAVERTADDLGFQDRPVVDRGGADRPAAGSRQPEAPRREDGPRREDEGRREGRRDGGRSSGRGRRGDDGRRSDASDQGDAPRGTAGERRGVDRPLDDRSAPPRHDTPRSSGRGDAVPGAGDRGPERSLDRRDDEGPGDDRESLEGRGGDGDRAEGESGAGEPRRGRRRRGRRGGRGRGGRDRDDAPRGDGAPRRIEDGPAPDIQRDDSADDEFGFAERRPTEEPARQERRPAQPRRHDDADRRPRRDRDGERSSDRGADRGSERSSDRGGERSQPPRGDQPAPAAGFDWDAPIDRPPTPPRSQATDRAPPRRAERDDDGWGGIDLEPRQPADDVAGDGAPVDGESRGDSGDEQSGRRRRRRGRRGGRRRGGRERTGDDRPSAEQGSDESAPVTRGDDGPEDEPLPSGYGRAPAAPRPAAGGEGESRGRRRRGRGDRKSSTPRAGASAEPTAEGAETKGRGRSSRRGSGGRSRRAEPELRPTSRLSRGRRDDFAPVAGGYDEDDEGLDFLGIEDAGRETPRTEARRSDDDELLADSGLSSVTDVPSWVEAIGIVIASNLDARNRPPRGGDDHDRGRRDGGRGGRG